jgi:hypothetical protein
LATRTRRMSLVMDAIQIALDQLAKMPDSPSVEALRSKAAAYAADAKGWAQVRPTAEHKEAMMKNVLALQIAVTKLGTERAPAPDASPSGDVKTRGPAESPPLKPRE